MRELRAIEAGATGYLLKDAPVDVLAAALRSASRGEMVLAPTVAKRLADYHRRQQEPTINVSARELQVLLAVAGGLTNAGIGLRLHIGESTVKTHLARIFEKLGVDDRTAAVTRAHELGLIRIDGPSSG